MAQSRCRDGLESDKDAEMELSCRGVERLRGIGRSKDSWEETKRLMVCEGKGRRRDVEVLMSSPDNVVPLSYQQAA